MHLNQSPCVFLWRTHTLICVSEHVQQHGHPLIVGVPECVFAALIEQLCPLLYKKFISSGTKWWMANSGSHMGCFWISKGKGITGGDWVSR